MRLNRSVVGILVLAVVSVTGCMTVNLDTGSIREPVSMSGEVNREYKVVRHFDRPLRSWFTLFQLVTVRNPQVEEVIREELERSGGDAVVNLVIKGQDTFVDQLIPVALSVLGSAVVSYSAAAYDYTGVAIGTLLTIGASQIRARTYTVSGDVVRYDD